MRSGGQNPARGRFRLLALLVVLGGTASALASDSIVYFKNGRALRVLDTRTEGDWVYLLISEPRPSGRRGEEEEPGEIGVRADSIARIETARTAAAGAGGGRGPRNPAAGRAANGVVREHTPADSLAAARSSMPGGGTLEEALKSVPNVPALGTPEARRYRPSSSAPTNPDDVKPGSSTAGYEILAPLRNMRPPRHILERAKELQEQRRREREARQAAKSQPPAPTPEPPPEPAPPAPAPDGDGADGPGN